MSSINQQFIDKLNEEFQEYLSELQQKSKDQIIAESGKTAVMDLIVYLATQSPETFFTSLPGVEQALILSTDKLLELLYQEFLSNYKQNLEESIVDSIKTMLSPQAYIGYSRCS